MVFLIWVSGTSEYGWAPGPRDTGTGCRTMEALGPAACWTCSRSRATMRPSGPLPLTSPRFRPRSAAMRRARGDALIRSPEEAVAVEANAGAGRDSEGAGAPSVAAFAGGAGGMDVGWFRSGAGWVASRSGADAVFRPSFLSAEPLRPGLS